MYGHELVWSILSCNTAPMLASGELAWRIICKLYIRRDCTRSCRPYSGIQSVKAQWPVRGSNCGLTLAASDQCIRALQLYYTKRRRLTSNVVFSSTGSRASPLMILQTRIIPNTPDDERLLPAMRHSTVTTTCLSGRHIFARRLGVMCLVGTCLARPCLLLRSPFAEHPVA